MSLRNSIANSFKNIADLANSAAKTIEIHDDTAAQKFFANTKLAINKTFSQIEKETAKAERVAAIKNTKLAVENVTHKTVTKIDQATHQTVKLTGKAFKPFYNLGKTIAADFKEGLIG
jgi:hypothetical protein